MPLQCPLPEVDASANTTQNGCTKLTSCTSPFPSLLIFPISRVTRSPSSLTFAAIASRICLITSPRFGAGIARTAREASFVRIMASCVSLTVPCMHCQAPSYTPDRLTPRTVASSSPVAGHRDVKVAPDPCHSPSYTPGIGLPSVGRFTAERTFLALVDKCLPPTRLST